MTTGRIDDKTVQYPHMQGSQSLMISCRNSFVQVLARYYTAFQTLLTKTRLRVGQRH